MSDTPRTDRDTRTYRDASVEWQEELVPACACRIIERELNSANERIKRLEEIGTKLRECANQIGWTSSHDTKWIIRSKIASDAWDKETK